MAANVERDNSRNSKAEQERMSKPDRKGKDPAANGWDRMAARR